MKRCSVESCARSYYAKGLCSLHYNRKIKYGDTNRRPKNAARIAFIDKASSYEGDDCLIWPFSRNNKGYGRICIDGCYRIVSRVVCERRNGSPPTPDHEAAHSCGNGHNGCCNGKHLRWATSEENKADMAEHGTRPVGEKNGIAKLTEEAVREIRASKARGDGYKLARRFNVSEATISRVRRGHLWREVATAS